MADGWDDLPGFVDLGALLDKIELFIRRFVVVDEAQAAAAALWVPHTWAIDAAHATPYLYASSAEPESGKTRMLEVLRELVRNPILTMNVSDAALFRTIDSRKPTLFFDEVDAIFSPKARERGHRDDLRSLLNAGYRRGELVLRMGGGNNTTLETFAVFGPKCLAGLGTLPPTLASRCIRIELKRRRQDEPVEDFFPDRCRRRDGGAPRPARGVGRHIARDAEDGTAGPRRRVYVTAPMRCGGRCWRSPSSTERRGRHGPAGRRSRSPPARTKTRRLGCCCSPTAAPCSTSARRSGSPAWI